MEESFDGLKLGYCGYVLPPPFPLVWENGVMFYALFKFQVCNNITGEVVLLLAEYEWDNKFGPIGT